MIIRPCLLLFYEKRIGAPTKKMNQQMDDVLRLSQISQRKIHPQEVDVSTLCHQILSAFQNKNPTLDIEYSIEPDIKLCADLKLMSIVLEQLLDNALKFTSKKSKVLIEIGPLNKDAHHGIYPRSFEMRCLELHQNEKLDPFSRWREKVPDRADEGRSKHAFWKILGIYIKDNGVGFKILNNETPFHPFKKHHNPDEFPGIGLALVNRIISLHNGRLWATSEPNEGSIFYFNVFI